MITAIVAGLVIAVAMIIYALIRTGKGNDDIDPYNGDGF